VINCIIPSGLPNGNAYRIRVRSSNLASVGTDNGSNLTLSGTSADFVASNTFKVLPDNQVNFNFVGDFTQVAQYNWSFGDGGTSTASSPVHAYTSIGFYTVSLNVTTLSGCSVSVVKPAYIRVEQFFPSTIIPTNSNHRVNSIAMRTDSIFCFAMSNGDCLVSNNAGSSFTVSPTGVSTPLNSAAVTTGHWFVAGDNGVLKTATLALGPWQDFNLGTTESFKSVSINSATDVMVVGSGGAAYRYDGTNWNQQTLPFSDSLFAVYFHNNVAYAVGENGAIFKMSNNNWSALNSGVNVSLRGVFFDNPDVAYVVGDNGTILKQRMEELTLLSCFRVWIVISEA
jgi:PKD repeat protein